MSRDDLLGRFRELHQHDTFVMPNAHDQGSVRLLEALGSTAVATTSAGCGMALGKIDSTVTRDEVVAVVRSIASSTSLPLSVDSERCFAEEPGGIAKTIELLSEAGAVGCSIEDWHPAAPHALDPIDQAVDQVEQAVAAAERYGMVLTARCEGRRDTVNTSLPEVIERLRRFAAVGADCVYAAGLRDADDAARVLEAVDAPLNVMAHPGGPSVEQLRAVGVRRISVGHMFAAIAYGAFAEAAADFLANGTIDPNRAFIRPRLYRQAFSESE